MTHSLKAVLLDVDGTLLDSNDAHARAWLAAIHEHARFATFEQVRPLIGKGSDKLLQEVLGLSDESGEGQQMSARRREWFSHEALPHLKPTKGARALLERFVERGLQLVIATSASGEELDALLKQAGVDDLIDAAATSSDAQASKPDPDIVQSALRKAGLQPRDVLMLGDAPHDIEAAKAAGVETVVLRCGGWWRDADLAAALAIYDNPEDVLQHFDDSAFAR